MSSAIIGPDGGKSAANLTGVRPSEDADPGDADGALDAPVAPPTTASLQTAAMRGTAWTAAQALVGLPLAFAVNVVVARTLGPHGYGLVASYIAGYALILTVLNGGVSDATVQWGAAAYARGDRAQLIEICRRCAGYHMLVEAPLGAVAAAVLLHREAIWVQLVGAASAAVTMVLGTTIVLLTAMSMNAALAKLGLVVGVAIQLGVVTAAVHSHEAGPTWVVRLAIAILSPVGAMIMAPRDVLRASFTPLLPRRWPEGFIRFSVRTVIATLVATLVFTRSEVLVLDAYGKTAAAGLFALAAGLAAQMTAPIDAMLGPLIPAAASLVAVGPERAARAVLRGTRLSALLTVPIATVVVPALAVLAPSIYGHDFRAAGALFISLGIVSCLQSVLHPVSAFAGALRRPLLILGANAVGLVVDLGLVLGFIPVFGAAGAVIGNSAGQLVALAAVSWILRRHLNVSVQATAHALLPFVAVSFWVAGVSAGAVVARSDGLGLAAVTAGAIAAASVGGLLAIRIAGGLVTNEDLTAVDASFPRAAKHGRGLLGKLGLIRTPPN